MILRPDFQQPLILSEKYLQGFVHPGVTNEAPIFIQPVLNAGVIGSDQALCGAPATPLPLTEIAPASVEMGHTAINGNLPPLLEVPG
jgi:2-keto-3-deoxy-galactonokinase